LSRASETTLPPPSWELENPSISVPPPQKDALRGVRLIIIEHAERFTTHQDDGLSTIFQNLLNGKTYDLVATGLKGEQCPT